MLQNDINDPRTFERFLREQGFSRSRAKAITAKGFRSRDMEIRQEDIILNLENRRAKILMETKGQSSVDLIAVIGRWSSWQTLAVLEPSEPARFKLRILSLNHRALPGLPLLEVSYGARGARLVEEHRIIDQSKIYRISAGYNEIRLRAKGSVNTQRLRVYLVPVR